MPLFRSVITALLLFAAMLVMVNSGRGQDMQHDHNKMDGVGNFFATWNRPIHRAPDGTRTKSCCNTRDCQGVEVVRIGGKWFVRGHKFGRGKDVHIPDNLIEANQPDPRESPDGKSYACLDTTGAPLCLVLGSGM